MWQSSNFLLQFPCCRANGFREGVSSRLGARSMATRLGLNAGRGERSAMEKRRFSSCITFLLLFPFFNVCPLELLLTFTNPALCQIPSLSLQVFIVKTTPQSVQQTIQQSGPDSLTYCSRFANIWHKVCACEGGGMGRSCNLRKTR